MPTKTKLKPRLPIGTPFIRAPEPATLIGDRTGTPYARVGDNPNGPEMLMVTPPPLRSPPSLAGGGMALVGTGGGASNYDPFNLQRQQLQQRRAMLNAKNNVADNAAVGQAKTLQSMNDSRYASLGVPTPATIDVPQGQNADAYGPTVRTSIRPQTSYLADQFESQNIDAETSDLEQRAALYRQSQSGSGGSTGGGGGDGTYEKRSGPSLAAQPAQGGATGMYGGPPAYGSSYQDYPLPSSADREKSIASTVIARSQSERPSTTMVNDYNDAQAQKAKAKVEQRNKDAGLVGYRDPFNPATQEWLTPAEAAIRKAKDNKRLDDELLQLFPEKTGDFSKLSETELVDIILNPSDPADPAEAELARATMRGRGYSDRGIDRLIRNEKIRAASKKKLSLQDLLQLGSESGVDLSSLGGAP